MYELWIVNVLETTRFSTKYDIIDEWWTIIDMIGRIFQGIWLMRFRQIMKRYLCDGMLVVGSDTY